MTAGVTVRCLSGAVSKFVDTPTALGSNRTLPPFLPLPRLFAPFLVFRFLERLRFVVLLFEAIDIASRGTLIFKRRPVLLSDGAFDEDFNDATAAELVGGGGLRLFLGVRVVFGVTLSGVRLGDTLRRMGEKSVDLLLSL